MLNPKSQIPNPKQIPISNFQNSKLTSFGHWLFGHWLLFGIWCLVIGIFISGCARIIEGAKGVAGLSTKTVEDNRKDAIKKTFNCSYNECRDKIMASLKRYGSYVYSQDNKKKMLAIYVSDEDTTPVGIFFKVVNDNNTEIQVSSPSTYAKEFIAKRISKALEPQKEKGESDAEKDYTDK